MTLHEILSYLQVMRKRWWVFAVVASAALGAILVSAYAAPQQYEASVRFMVNVPPSSEVALYPTFDSPSQNQEVASTRSAFIEVLKSPVVIRGALNKLGLSYSLREVSQNLSVEQSNDSQFVQLTVRASKPQDAADLANALLETGREYFGELQAASTASAREFISVQVEEARERLVTTKQALKDFKQQHDVTDLNAEITSERDIIIALKLSTSSATVDNNQPAAQAYGQEVRTHQLELQRLTALSDQYDALRDEISNADGLYKFLLDKETEAKLKENEILQASFIQLVDRAFVPEEPVSPVDLRILALAVVVSLLASVLLTLALEYRETHRPNRRVRTDPLANPANGD